MATMKAMQLSEAGGDFEYVEKDIPSPGEQEVLIKVQACGICHSDQFVKEGGYPGLEYPRVPGHEVVGIIQETGSNVSAQWEEGRRVGVGWHGGHCHQCEACRRGDFINCENARVTGINFDGGYAEYMVAPESALAAMPATLDSAEAAPLLCAGITTYNALRHSGAQPGDLVAIQGIGGLGHLAVQYASNFGFDTVAISRSPEKEKLAMELGAHHFIDADQEDPAEALQKMGGARLILATAPSSRAITSIINGLGTNGELRVVAATNDPIEVTPFQLIPGRKSLSGWPSGTAKDSEDTLNFSALTDIVPTIETFPLEEAGEAYDRMISNEARFRVVLTME